MATLPTPGGSDVWGANLNTAIKAMTNGFDAPTDWGADLGYDLEFETNGTSLPSGWSWYNQGTSTWEVKHGAGLLTPQQSGGGDGGQRMIVRAIPTETTWQATVKVSGRVALGDYCHQGLVLRDSVSGKYTGFGQRTASAITVIDWSALETYFGRADVSPFSPQVPLYLRVTKLSGGNHNFEYSYDGFIWFAVVSNRTPYATYNQIGFWVTAPASSTAATYPFHWFRVR